jgi:hypothetical protein
MRDAIAFGRAHTSRLEFASLLLKEVYDFSLDDIADFAEAINSRDVNRVLGLMAETLQIVVCNVGGGRGRSRLWTEPSVQGVRAETAELFGRSVVVMIRDGHLYDVLRIDEDAGQLTRLTDYCYAPEVLSEVAGTPAPRPRITSLRTCCRV